jgi:hypothetical protein
MVRAGGLFVCNNPCCHGDNTAKMTCADIARLAK